MKRKPVLFCEGRRVKLLKNYIPEGFKFFLWSIVPKFYILNTYILTPSEKKQINSINSKYLIRKINELDLNELKKAYQYRGQDVYEKKVFPRLKSGSWTGLAVFDGESGEIAYIAWIIEKSIPYIEEFGIILKPGQFLLKDGYCVPRHRHQGLHTRMEQERINYCHNHHASAIFIQIQDENKKGISSVLENGYRLYLKTHIIQWPFFSIYRPLSSFLKNPFKKIVK